MRETTVVVTGLQPGQLYHFRVKAQNAVDWSLPGKESESFRTPLDPSRVASPSFVCGLHDITVMEHEKVEFVVEVSGLPPPTVEWFVNNKSVEEDSRVTVVADEDFGTYSLVLNDVLAADGGEIKCVAVNQVGQTSTTAFFSVEGERPALENHTLYSKDAEMDS